MGRALFPNSLDAAGIEGFVAADHWKPFHKGPRDD